MSANSPSAEGFRLSAQQEHLWLLHRNGFPLAARASIAIEGVLDPEILEDAWRRIVERQEILRTEFHSLPGVAIPLQVIGDRPAAPFVRHDLRGLPAGEQEARIGDLWRGLEETADDGLVATRLVALTADRHLLLLRLPSLCADRVTLELLAEGLGRAYGAVARGEEIDGDSMQYVDFCEWQHEILESEETAAGREHWRRQDIGALLAVRLPGQGEEVSGDPLPETASGTATETVPLALDPRQLAEIDRLERQEGVRAEIFLLTCWQALLARLTGQTEVLVGVASTGRKFAELRDALGPFAQSLPVRLQAGEGRPFREILRQVEEAHREAFEWQESLTWRAWGDPAKGLLGLPFGFSFTEASAGFSGQGLSLALDRWSVARSTEIELDCLRGPGPGGALTLALRADARRFSREETERLAGRLADLIGHALAAPDATLGDLESLTGAERVRLLVELNETGAPFPAEECCHQLLRRQAERTPDAWAVVSDGGDADRLTYRELHERAGRLAHFLRKLGVASEVRVGLCVSPSVEMVVGILGILEAGGAYVPTDPSYPAERLAFVLQDAGAPVVLTQEAYRERLSAQGLATVCLDSGWGEIEREEASAPAVQVRPENLAYVIYTSGSTGRPKGVLVQHRNLVHSLTARLGYYRDPVSAFLLLSSVAFDSSVAGIFGTLAQGGTLVLPEEDARRDAPRLVGLIERHGISHLLSLPSLYAGLLETAGDSGRLASLREVIVAGEACPPVLVARHFRRLPQVGLYNEYGPTEGTVWSTVYEFPKDGEEVLIGRPIANMRTFLLNPRLRPVPEGVPGELFIAGAGLARGYHLRPDLTAERFLPDPFAGPGDEGGRLYRTGDLVRLRPDGNLEFLGRADNQVKIRGYRIELEEIEAVLGRHASLREAVVLAREHQAGDARLVAYVIPQAEAKPAVAELRAFLAERLPDYMIPSAFVSLDRFPLTPNGKVDRRALPAPDAVRSGMEADYVAPRTFIEEVMADIWADVLGVQKVGATSNFFELGGHSLLATQLVARLREALRVDLTVVWLFETPVLEKFALRVEEAFRRGDGIDDLPVERVDRSGPLPLSFGQQRLWFIDQLEPGSSAYNVARSFRVSGHLDPAALAATLTEVVRRHEVLRTVFAAADGQPVQVVLEPAPQPLPAVDLRALPEPARQEEVRRLAAEEVALPFDLARGPLLRTTLLRTGDSEHGVLFTMHHIVSDAWSMGLLVREMVTLYEAFVAGRPSPLPELSIQYADFAAWQRRRLDGEALEAELAFWRERLAGAPALLALPTDRPRPAVQSFRGGEVAFTFPPALSQALRALGRAHAVTPFMTLLGAFQTLLGRHARQEDVSVGSPIAGRTRREIEGLIGFFVNTLVLRADLRGAPSFRDLLRQVRNVSLAAHLHQDLPFEKLVEELAPERNLDHTPLFQVIFALQHPMFPEVSVGDLELRPLVAERETVKFDLTLLMSDTGESFRGVLGYKTDLFDAPTAGRLLAHLEALLEAAVADPDLPLSRLSLLREAERHQLAVEWNDTSADLGPATIPQLFAEQVAKTPEAVAVVFAGERLTYRELDRRSNRLAGFLRELGVGPESRVGLSMHRSAEMVVALLGILKAGGAYVPLDPSYPVERLAFMAADAELSLILTRTDLAATVSGAAVVCLDGEEETRRIEARDGETPWGGIDPEGLAYVMYTSGSTGLPKGVAVAHRSVVRLVRRANFAELGAEGVFLQLAPVSFDASTLEIWGALLNGGRLVLYPETRFALEDLGRTLRDEQVTSLWLTAGLFHQMVEERPGDLAPVRQLLAGGDVLSPRHVRKIVEEVDGLTLINGYGPTENTTFTCCHPVRVETRLGASVPIGRPVTDTVVHLLDEEMGPVPVGVAGELYTGGAGLARGYLNRPALTAERFVPSPFGEPGGRLYRTGDLARHLPDGTLEFLGRVDQQVKIRGFRIEPGEIETALRSHGAVEDAAVVAVDGKGGDRRLVAWVVAAGERDAADLTTELKSHLGRHLPDFMVPSAILVLDELPLTPTGKLDRRRLLATDPGRPVLARERVAPRNPIETETARIWAEVLGLDEVGVHDDFFELGGHSLLATQVVSRLRQSFAREIPLRLMFETRTVAELAKVIARSGELAAQDLVPIAAVEPQIRDLDDLLAELELSETATPGANHEQ